MDDQTDPRDRSEQQLERRYKVRQVTDYQFSWTERDRGAPGAFTLQLILDNGVEEYILSLESSDVSAIFKLLRKSPHTTFDLERKVLMFGNLGA